MKLTWWQGWPGWWGWLEWPCPCSPRWKFLLWGWWQWGGWLGWRLSTGRSWLVGPSSPQWQLPLFQEVLIDTFSSLSECNYSKILLDCERDGLDETLCSLPLKSFPSDKPACQMDTIALCNKSNGRYDIKAEKREELESKSSHKSDIWPPAASKKWGEIYWKYIFQTIEVIFPYKGVFFTKVVKANIIAFIKTKIFETRFVRDKPPLPKMSALIA